MTDLGSDWPLATLGPTFVVSLQIHPEKQLPLLLDALAFSAIPQDLGNLRLLVMVIHHLQSFNSRAGLGLTSQVKWHGFVEGESKQALLQQGDGVLPSVSEGPWPLPKRMLGTPAKASCIWRALSANVRCSQALSVNKVWRLLLVAGAVPRTTPIVHASGSTATC